MHTNCGGNRRNFAMLIRDDVTCFQMIRICPGVIDMILSLVNTEHLVLILDFTNVC